jgi:hypothetical protein
MKDSRQSSRIRDFERHRCGSFAVRGLRFEAVLSRRERRGQLEGRRDGCERMSVEDESDRALIAPGSRGEDDLLACKTAGVDEEARAVTREPDLRLAVDGRP